jgi:Ca-activated chloride channel family protein
MNTHKISPDDPRLTAFALNEMDPAERAEFARMLEEDTAAQAAVDEIRTTAQMLGTALETEPVPTPTPVTTPVPADEYATPKRGKILRFPQLYFVVSGLAAACFAVMFAVWSQTRPHYETKQYVEVSLAKKAANRDELAQKQAPESRMADTAPVSVALPAANEPETAAAGAVAKVKRLDEDDKTVVLSPFTVTAAADQGSSAQSVLAGSRAAPLPIETGGPTGVGGSLQSADAKDKEEATRYAGNFTGGRPVAGLITRERARQAAPEFNTETYARVDENPFQATLGAPLSTFSIDVDTAAYANLRRFLAQGRRPPRDAVRIEEMINYFPYHYAPPAAGGAPFAASLEVAVAPWAPAHRLVRIGLKGREVSDAARPPANLVFLLDVSGSMDEPNKLPLVKQSLRMLVNRLRPDDRVAIVVYAGASGLALPSTSAAQKARILDAIDELQPGGSTNGEAGIQLAYDIAKANFIPGGVNRVILATDGDFNVGTTSEGELTRLVEEKAKSGVFLTVLGFGMGNYKDAMLVTLADKGNGNYAYIDTAAEARKALVEQAGGTLVTIAKDVKIQVEFNPAQVQSYRLIGYEKRMLRTEDFNNDKVDAGEIGAGHTVTALYEIVPVGVVAPETGKIDPLRYQQAQEQLRRTAANGDELLTLKIRYKAPTGDVSSKVEFPLRDAGGRFEQASADFKFSAAVAAFGMILRESPYKGAVTLADVTTWARSGLEEDAGGYRSEFLELVSQAGATSQ